MTLQAVLPPASKSQPTARPPVPAHAAAGAGFSRMVEMTDDEFRLLGNLVHSLTGIKMPGGKRTLLESRLQRRLQHLGMPTFRAYYDHVTAENPTAVLERVQMTDLVTTNKTDFFREASHFDFLTRYFDEQGLPGGATPAEGLRVWSAGCSSGEEPYTLAIVLDVLARGPYSIYATDISQRVLERARQAVYDVARIAPVPEDLRQAYFLRSRNAQSPMVRVCPYLRSKVTFNTLNFMDPQYEAPHPMHIIFCRNVLIYFEKHTQEAVIGKLVQHLKPGGLLFLGHSESIFSHKLPLRQLQPTVYQRT